MARQSGIELLVDSTVVRQHHPALAGGTLTSPLQNNHPLLVVRTPPGFSRWYFNFLATKGLVNTERLLS